MTQKLLNELKLALSLLADSGDTDEKRKEIRNILSRLFPSALPGEIDKAAIGILLGTKPPKSPNPTIKPHKDINGSN